MSRLLRGDVTVLVALAGEGVWLDCPGSCPRRMQPNHRAGCSPGLASALLATRCLQFFFCGCALHGHVSRHRTYLTWCSFAVRSDCHPSTSTILQFEIATPRHVRDAGVHTFDRRAARGLGSAILAASGLVTATIY